MEAIISQDSSGKHMSVIHGIRILIHRFSKQDAFPGGCNYILIAMTRMHTAKIPLSQKKRHGKPFTLSYTSLQNQPDWRPLRPDQI
jgi:hypothetical protein